MRGVSRGFRRYTALFTLLTLLLAHGAEAKGWREERAWRQQFERAKRFVVTVLGRFGWPPGEPIDDDPSLTSPAESSATTEG